MLEVSADLPCSFKLNTFGKVELLNFVSGELVYTINGTKATSDSYRLGLEGKRERKNGQTFTVSVEYSPVNESDLHIDFSWRFMDIEIIERKARELTEKRITIDEKVASIYRYVAQLPINEEFWRTNPQGLGRPPATDYLIQHHTAAKCTDRAQAFIDLCRIVEIPARDMGALYIQRRGKFLWKTRLPPEPHAAAMYFQGQNWVPVDPTLNHCGEELDKKEYFLNSATIQIYGDAHPRISEVNLGKGMDRTA